MDAEERAHLEALRSEMLKRLRVRELQAARAGNLTEPVIINEIKDLREEIACIDQQLGPAQQPASWAEYGPLEQVEIKLKGDFATLTPDVRDAAIRAFAAVVNIPPERIILLEVKQGSIVFRLLVPGKAAELLVEFFASGDPLVAELDIERVRVVGRHRITG
jgi:hypothetical protein